MRARPCLSSQKGEQGAHSAHERSTPTVESRHGKSNARENTCLGNTKDDPNRNSGSERVNKSKAERRDAKHGRSAGNELARPDNLAEDRHGDLGYGVGDVEDGEEVVVLEPLEAEVFLECRNACVALV
jgi:hypothetical protein